MQAIRSIIGKPMKKLVWAILTIHLFVATSAQELQHDAIAINIEVPVRVFKGNQFIDHLTIDDFEVYEDGIIQKIEAVYLIKKTEIAREDTLMKKEEARLKSTVNMDEKHCFEVLVGMLNTYVLIRKNF